MRYITKYLLFTLCLVSSLVINATTPQEALDIVTNFNYYMSVWSRNPGDIEARDGLKLICNNGQNMRVADRLALEKCTTTDDNTILLGSYLRIFEDRRTEKIKYIIKNPKVEEVATKYATDNTNIISVVADVEVKSVSLNYMMKNVFYIKDNKICFIGDYAKETAQNERIEISKLNCPIWLSDSIIEADWDDHSLDIKIKSDSEWNVELNKNWNKDGERLNNWWCDWRVSKRNDSTLHIFMTHNLRTSTYSDSIILKTSESQKTIRIIQHGYNLHKATINNCSIEQKTDYYGILHIDFDAYNLATKGDTQFFVVVGIPNHNKEYAYYWQDKVEYQMKSGKHLHKKDFRMKIPYYNVPLGRQNVEIFIMDSYGNTLEKKIISIIIK